MKRAPKHMIFLFFKQILNNAMMSQAQLGTFIFLVIDWAYLVDDQHIKCNSFVTAQLCLVSPVRHSLVSSLKPTLTSYKT